MAKLQEMSDNVAAVMVEEGFLELPATQDQIVDSVKVMQVSANRL